MQEGGGKMKQVESNEEISKGTAQPMEYILFIPQVDAELEINIQHPKQHKKTKENT